MKMRVALVRSLTLGAALLISPLLSQAATIYTITPGQFLPANSSVYPVGGTVQDTVISPFNSGVLAGTLTSQVISGDAGNPLGGLTFTYLLDMSLTTQHAASQLTVSAFGSFLTDVSYNPAGGGVAPSIISRSVDGSVVRFTFFNEVDGGQSSALLIVQTDALSWSPTTAAIINGESLNVAALAPLAVPEPTSAALLLSGLGAFLAFRRARS